MQDERIRHADAFRVQEALEEEVYGIGSMVVMSDE